MTSPADHETFWQDLIYWPNEEVGAPARLWNLFKRITEYNLKYDAVTNYSKLMHVVGMRNG